MPALIRLILLAISLVLITAPAAVLAQARISVTGAQAGFPIAVPELCGFGEQSAEAASIAKTIREDLKISGFFKMLEPSTYVETPGKCDVDGAPAYSDWSVIDAEGLVKGDIRQQGSNFVVRLYLHDVLQQKAVLGKKYEVGKGELTRIAHRFANEIVGYFTGERGVFGSRIAYVSRVGRFKELFVMDMSGSDAKQLTYDKGLAITPSWSPDGNRIAYTSYKTRRPDLYTMKATGGDVRRLTKREGLELGAEYSPDGQSLAAAASVSGVSKIALFDLSGRLLRRLTHSSSIDVSPTWSPDGRTLAFCSNRAGGPQIYLMGQDGSGIRRISYTGSNYCTSPSWSPKGDKIAYVCRVGSANQIFVGPSEGGDAVQLTYSGNNEDPSFSPDGRYLAVSSTAVKGARSVVMVNLQSGQTHQLTAAAREDSQPAWSPAGE